MMSDTLYALAAADGQLYAARESGLYRSEDRGAHWSALYEPLGLDTPLPTTCVAVQGALILAGVPGGVLHSTDAGAHWQFRRFTTPAPFITALTLTDTLALAGTLEDGAFCSPDGGITWLPQNYGLLDPCVLALTAAPEGVAFAGTSSGLFRSSGGRSWQQTSFPRTPVLSLAFTSEGVLLVGTESAGLWRSRSQVDDWQLSTPQPLINHISVTQTAAFATAERHLLSSRNQGQTWYVQHGFDTPITALAASSSGPLWIALNDTVHLLQPFPR
jgi:ligand-binding sensor domain-containing protein